MTLAITALSKRSPRMKNTPRIGLESKSDCMYIFRGLKKWQSTAIAYHGRDTAGLLRAFQSHALPPDARRRGRRPVHAVRVGGYAHTPEVHKRTFNQPMGRLEREG